MAKKETPRSKYIRNVTEAQAALSEQMERSTRLMLKDVLHESVKEGISKMFLAEADEDKFDEEEATAALGAEDIDNQSEEGDAEPEQADAEADEQESADADGEAEPAEGETPEEEEPAAEGDDADGEVWDKIEGLQGEDGEYDLTGMDGDEVIKVLKVMTPEDGVRVVKTSDGNIKLSDENTQQEYVIDTDALDDEDDEEFEVDTDELADMIESVVNSDEGFEASGRFYDNMDTPMTTPSNDEPSTDTYSMDKGVPTGTKKPYPGKVGKTSPFTESEEGGECELDLSEVVNDFDDEPAQEGEGDPEIEETVSGFTKKNSTSKSLSPNTSCQSGKFAPRNGSVAGRKVKSTSEPRYAGGVDESIDNIKRKANAIFEENKKMRKLIDKLHTQLQENAVTFHSMGRIVKLLTENTTTRDEKIDIVNRFNDVKSVNEGKALYSTILTELKSVNKTRNVGGLTESKIISENAAPAVVEKNLYKSGEVSRMTDLWDRMSKIK